ncbi:FtsX-like permease family protein [Prolixibacteraceae bacterium JC049]|nr:FtsX-like permease family protein [Prolixibacteraceae bacterium JC049]
MWRQNIRIALRNNQKKPIYTIISILGFTVGIAASLLIYLWVFDELQFEKFHPDHDRTYRVLTLKQEGGQIVKTGNSFRPLAHVMKRDFPQIENATYLSHASESSPLQLEWSDKKVAARYAWTNLDFFKVFGGFEFVEGNAKSAFTKADDIVLSQELAHKLFGNESALGKSVVVDKYYKRIYTVGAVVKLPRQTHIHFDYLVSEKNRVVQQYMTSWHDSYWVRTYIKLKKDIVVSGELVNQMAGVLGKYQKRSDKLMFQPLDDIHLYSDYETGMADKRIGNIKYVWIFGGLALLIILMVTFNFVSLTVARASERTKEVGIRKVAGSGKRQLYLQFVLEALVQTVIATLLALLLMRLMLPWFEQLTQKTELLSFSTELVGSLLLITLFIGVGAGIYPAFYLTAHSPVMIFKGGSATGSKAGFTKGLVVVQFSIAMVLIMFTGIIYKQLNLIQNHDIGLQKKDMVVVETGLWYSIGAFKQELKQHPNILSVSASTSAPIRGKNEMGFSWNGANATDTLRSDLYWGDEHFADTYGLKVSKGTFLKSDYRAYWQEQKKANDAHKKKEKYAMSIPVVVNEAFAQHMNVDNPIGMRLNHSYVVVGVVEDFNLHSLHSKVGPVVMTNDPQCMGVVNIHIREENRAETLAFINAVYKKHRGGREMKYHFFDDELKQNYFAEFQLGGVLIRFSLLAVCIAILGILGLAAFASERRVKEIGVRKVNGAKDIEVLAMLNMDFLKWVVVAFVIAAPLAWYIADGWLQNFSYKTEISWWIFAISGLIALVTALLTISFQSYKAATRNPVDALRYE